MPRPRLPKDAQALYDQGLAYLHSFVWIEAARSFNAALRVDPKLALAHVGLSVAYVELSRDADARKAIDAAQALAAAASRSRSAPCRRARTADGGGSHAGRRRKTRRLSPGARRRDRGSSPGRGVRAATRNRRVIGPRRSRSRQRGQVGALLRARAGAVARTRRRTPLPRTRSRKRGTRTGGAGSFSDLREAGTGGAARAPHARP